MKIIKNDDINAFEANCNSREEVARQILGIFADHGFSLADAKVTLQLTEYRLNEFAFVKKPE